MKKSVLFMFASAIICSVFLIKTENVSSATSTGAIFPLSYSEDKSYLIDASGKPFLIQGDSPWSILVQLNREDTLTYLNNRQQNGFNMLVVNLIENTYMTTPPQNAYGDKPFTGKLPSPNNTIDDFSTPNEAYFAHVDFVLAEAAARGIAVLLNPAYMGYGIGDTRTDGWWVDLIANGTSRSRTYGRWLGDRYKNYTNIIWVAGGDRTPPATAAGTLSFLELLKGVKEKAPNHLWTAHWQNNIDSMDMPLFREHMGLNGVYVYPPAPVTGKFSGTGFVHKRMLDAYNDGYAMPFFLWESWYEWINWDKFETPRQVLRQAAYEANLSGSAGQNFGSYLIWTFGAPAGNGVTNYPNWKENLNSPGALDMKRVGQFFSKRPWYDLVPDQYHTVVTGGYGTLGTESYVSAAYTNDKKNAYSYISSTGTGSRTVTVNMGFFSGNVTTQWYNPTNGSYIPIGSYANGGSRNFTTPGNNDTGTNDWILALEVSADPPPPPPPTNNLIAHWKLDDPAGSTTIIDSAPSSIKNSGTNVGAVMGVPGKINTASLFNGAAGGVNRIEIPDPGTNSIFDFGSGKAVTISAWIRPGNLVPEPEIDPAFSVIVKNGWNYGILAYTWPALWSQSKAHLAFVYMDTTYKFCEYFVNTPIVFNNTYHIAATQTFGSGNLFKFYINGVAQNGSWARDDGTSCDGSIAPIVGNDSIWIGADKLTLGRKYTEEWIGMIDDVRIYNKHLTQAEITELANPINPPVFAPADVNRDGRVNIKDIQEVIRCIISIGSCAFPDRSDVNGDGSVNIKDIQEIIKVIINPN